ncbi:MAG: 50S ribosomal protein L18 [Archaeoglobaceae archaeon]
MATGPRYRVKYRRRREGKTNYKKRAKLLLSRKPRVIVRISNMRVIVQVAKYEEGGDRIMVTTDSTMLKEYGWKGHTANTPSAYLTGFLAGKKASKEGIEEAVMDIGLATPVKGSKIFAVLKGIIDSGIAIHHNPEVFPDDSRIKGEHIAEYYNKAPQKFSEYDKKGLKPSDLPHHFEEVKNEIDKSR